MNTQLQRGSLSWHLARLQPGDAYLVADNGKGTAQQQNLATTANRLEKRVRGVKFLVRSCYGMTHTANNSFHFYRIERVR